MASNENTQRFPTRTGHIEIDGETVRVETTNFLTGIKRHFNHHPLVVLLLGADIGIAILIVLVSIIFNPEFLEREVGLLLLSVVVLYFLLLILVKAVRSDVTTDSAIPISSIEYVTYRVGDRIRGPKFVIVYDDESKKRQVWCNLPGFGGASQLESGLEVFDQNEIPIRD